MYNKVKLNLKANPSARIIPRRHLTPQSAHTKVSGALVTVRLSLSGCFTENTWFLAGSVMPVAEVSKSLKLSNNRHNKSGHALRPIFPRFRRMRSETMLSVATAFD